MFLNHPFLEDEEIVKNMEENHYDLEKPAIDPEDLKALCEDDPVLMKCYEDMIVYCNRYAHDVFTMLYEQKVVEEMRKKGEDTQEAFEELKVIDQKRHLLHNAVMDAINLVSRELGKRGKDNSWLLSITGGKKWESCRAEYMTFALLTYYRIHSKMSIPSQV